MAQPTPYEREFNFSNQQAATPSDPIPAPHLDAELNRVKLTLDQTLTNLALIQQDDGTIDGAALGAGTVGYDQLDPEIVGDLIAAGATQGAFDAALEASQAFSDGVGPLALDYEVPKSAETAGGTPAPVTLRSQLDKKVLFDRYYYSTNGSGAAKTAMNNAILAAASISSDEGLGRRVPVETVSDLMECNDSVEMKNNVVVENLGILKWTGDASQGHFVYFGGTTNAEFYGGVIDCADVGNTNGLAVGGFTANTDFYIHDVTVKNVRMSGSSPGTGGGKGLTIQHGANRGIVHGIRIQDCDIGFSLEGRSANPTRNFQLSDISVYNAEYMGCFLLGTAAGNELSPTYISAIMENIGFYDCAEDQSDYGVITSNLATSIKGRGIQIYNSTGRVNIFKGAMRFCDFEAFADVNALRSAIDHTPYAGDNPQLVSSRSSRIGLGLQIRSTGATGYLIDADGTYPPATTEHVIRFAQWNGSNYTGGDFDGTGLVNSANIASTSRYEIVNTANGKFYANAGDVAASTVAVPAYRRDPGTITTVADDTVHSYTPLYSRGVLVCSLYASRAIILHYDLVGVGAGPRFISDPLVSSDFVVTGGASSVPTGTTGTDGKINITSDGTVIYFENRIGGNIGPIIKELM